jgi:plasmid stabilization system protein ParE
VRYAFQSDAAREHEEQIAYYEARAKGLGRRYHEAFLEAIRRICEAPHRCRLVQAPLRRLSLRDFPFSVIFRESNGTIRILAVAAHRKRPDYWLARD